MIPHRTSASKNQVAAIVGKTTRTIDNWLKRGLIPAPLPDRVNGQLVFDLKKLFKAVIKNNLSLSQHGEAVYKVVFSNDEKAAN